VVGLGKSTLGSADPTRLSNRAAMENTPFSVKKSGKKGVNHLQNTWLNIHFPELCWIEDISRYIRLESFSVADDFLDFNTLQKVISQKIDW